jgi:hypothetical protein
MACMTINHMHTTFNHIEEVEDEAKEDTPVYIYMDNRSAVDMNISFKDTKNARHIRRINHFVKQGVQDEWHTLAWIRNQSMVADRRTFCTRFSTCSPSST